MNRFLQAKAARFDQLPGGLDALLVPEANRLLLCVDRRTDIFATPLASEPPDFVQHRDRTCGIDLAHEVYPSGGQRQAPLWDQEPQASAQQPQPPTASHLRGGLAIE